jgi:hypothetical protein
MAEPMKSTGFTEGNACPGEPHVDETGEEEIRRGKIPPGFAHEHAPPRLLPVLSPDMKRIMLEVAEWFHSIASDGNQDFVLGPQWPINPLIEILLRGMSANTPRWNHYSEMIHSEDTPLAGGMQCLVYMEVVMTNYTRPTTWVEDFRLEDGMELTRYYQYKHFMLGFSIHKKFPGQ